MSASSDNSWTVYIIETTSGSLYTGITTDLTRRFNEHQHSKKGARYFRSTDAVRVCYQEHCADRSSASKREASIKSLSRAEKLALIAACSV